MHYLPILILGYCCFILAMASLSPISSVDIFWHLKMGEDFILRGISPLVENYSLEFKGASLKGGVYFLFQTAIASLHLLLDKWGLVLYRFATWFFGLLIIYWVSKKRKINVEVLLFLLVSFAVLITHRRLIRPELMSYVFILSYVAIYFLRGINQKTFLIYACLQLIWSNWHGSSLFGFILLGGFLFQSFLDGKGVRDKCKFALMYISFLALGFINPALSNSLFTSLFESGVSHLIVEYRPLRWENAPFIYILYLLLLVFPVGYQLKRKKYGLAFLLVAFACCPLYVKKLFPHMVSATILFFIPVLNQKISYVPQGFIRLNKKLQGLTILIFVSTLVFAWGGIGYTFLGNKSFAAHWDKSAYPLDVEKYLQSKTEWGPTFNEYGYGGYLLYYHYPRVQPIMDGRIYIFYPLDYFNNFLTAERNGADFLNWVKKYKIESGVTLLRKDQSLLITALESDLFNLEFVGTNNVIFSKSEEFKEISQLFLDFGEQENVDFNAVKREIIKANEKWGENYLGVWLKFVGKMLDSGNPNLFLQSMTKMAVDIKNPDYEVTRSLAVWNFKQGDPIMAFKLFTRIKNRFRYTDKLYFVELSCLLEKCRSAVPVFLSVGTYRNSMQIRTKISELYSSIVSVRGKSIFSKDLHSRINRFIKTGEK